jgi:hypothetical protein
MYPLSMALLFYFILSLVPIRTYEFMVCIGTRQLTVPVTYYLQLRVIINHKQDKTQKRLVFKPHLKITIFYGRSMTLAVSRWPFTAESKVQTQTCGRPKGNGKRFCLSISPPPLSPDSFHKCSMLIHPPITENLKSQRLTEVLNNILKIMF